MMAHVAGTVGQETGRDAGVTSDKHAIATSNGQTPEKTHKSQLSVTALHLKFIRRVFFSVLVKTCSARLWGLWSDKLTPKIRGPV